MKARDQGRRHIKHIYMAAQQHRIESKLVGKQAKEQPIANRPVNKGTYEHDHTSMLRKQ